MAAAVAARAARSVSLPCPADEAFAFVADVEASARLFPLLEAIGRAPSFDRGDARAWRTRLRPQGPGAFAVQPEYVSRYTAHPEERRLVWTPVPDEGNALVAGSCQVEDEGAGCRVLLSVEMETTLPAPRLAARAIERAVQLGFDAAVTIHVRRIAAHLSRG